MIKIYKNCVIRFFNKPPKLMVAKQSFIEAFVKTEPDTLTIAYYPTVEMAKDMVKLASKKWNGEYSTLGTGI